MAGTLHILTNLISPVTGIIHLRSRNSKLSNCSFNPINNSFKETAVRDQPPPKSGGLTLCSEDIGVAVEAWPVGLFGLAFRESFKGLTDFADNNRKLLSILSVVLLSWVPWIQGSRPRSLLLMVKPTAFLVVFMMGMLLHLILLGFNAISIQCLCAVSGGHESIFATKGNSTALLIVASQIITDSFLVSYWNNRLAIPRCHETHGKCEICRF